MAEIQKQKTLIIGAGNIAQGYDNTCDDVVTTHVKAYRLYPEVFEVSAICDVNLELAVEVATKWNIKNVYSTLESISEFDFDIVSVCTPDETHGTLVKSLVELKPKIIILEKPVGLPYDEAERLFERCDEEGIVLLVNYSRLYSKNFQEIKRNYFQKNKTILSVDIKYNKGLDHNGSHLLNLCAYYFDFEVYKHDVFSSLLDYSESDPTISALCKCYCEGNYFDLILRGFSAATIDIFELDIITSNNRFRYYESNGGYLLIYKRVCTNKNLGIYEFLLSEKIPLDNSEYFQGLIELIVGVLKNEKDSDLMYKIQVHQKSVLKTINITTQIKK